MGLFYSKVINVIQYFSKRELKILMLGLDTAGKTTLLYKMKGNGTVNTISLSAELNIETVSPSKQATIYAWDMESQYDKMRSLREPYLTNATGLIYVVDSNNRDRMDEARGELQAVLTDMPDCCVPILILANKIDMPKAMRASDVAKRLDLNHELRVRPWHIASTYGGSGDGMYEGLDVFVKMMEDYKRSKTNSWF